MRLMRLLRWQPGSKAVAESRYIEWRCGSMYMERNNDVARRCARQGLFWQKLLMIQWSLEKFHDGAEFSREEEEEVEGSERRCFG
jgi:hypothetical protein